MVILLTVYIFLFSLPLISESKIDSPHLNDEFDVSKTLATIKNEVPQNVTLGTEGSTSLLLKWDPPITDRLITGYKIKFRPKYNSKSTETVTVDDTKRLYKIENLKKSTYYNVKIAAISNNETLVFSEWHSSQTADDDLVETQVPGQLDRVFLTPASSSIIVSWNPPVNQSIVIRGYIIGWGIGFLEKYTKVSDPKKISYTLENLTPLSEYVISLQAFNNKGNGPAVYETAWTKLATTPEPKSPLLPPVGLKATVLSSTSIILYWTDITLSSNFADSDNRHYQVKYTSNLHSNNPKYRYLNSTKFNYIIDDLKPNTQYEFAVKLIKGRRESTWSMTVVNTTFEAIPSSAPKDLTVAPSNNDDPNLLHLHWQPPKQTNGQIIGYEIYYTIDESLSDNEWMTESLIGDKLTTVIQDLIPESVYYFKIKVRNNKGYGPFSQTVSFKTLSDKKKATPFIITIAVIFAVAALIIILCAIFLFKSKKDHRYGNRKYKGYIDAPTNASGKSKNTRELKPPDLWIHHNGHLELKGLINDQQGEGVANTELDSQEIPLHRSTLERGKKINFTEAFYDDVHKSSSSPTDTSASLTSANSAVRRSLKSKPILMSVDGPSTSIVQANTSNLTFEPSTSLSRPIYPRTQFNTERAHVTLNHKDGLLSLAKPHHFYDPVASPPLQMGIGSNLNALNATTSANSFSSVASPNASAIRLVNSNPLKSFSIPSPSSSSVHQEGFEEPARFGQVASPHKKLPTSAFNSFGPSVSGLSPNKVSANSSFDKPVNQMLSANRNTITESLKKNEIVPTYSTEDLNQEMANLEGLMKDLNAITVSEFAINN